VTSEVVIDPPGAGLRVGGTQQLTATPRTSSGIPIPNRPVTWKSDDPDVATVSDNGLVTAVANGSAAITATVDQVTGMAPVTVTARPVAVVEVEPTSISLQIGQTRQLTTSLRAQDGSALSGRTVTFSSDAATVATVSSTGLVTGTGPGQTVVRVRSEGKEARATVSVSARPAARLSFSTQPQSGTVDRTMNTIRVAVQDELGNTVAAATHEVTLRFADNPSGARLEGTTSVRAANGIATFSDLRIDRPGSGYTLLATASGLSPALSNPFSMAGAAEPPPPPVASRLAIVVQPSSSAEKDREFDPQPVVQLQDGSGRNVAQSGVRIRVKLVGSGRAKLDGDREVDTDDDGRARFRNLRINQTGDFRLRFEADGFSPVESSVIRVRDDDDDD
jgi:hypothetical protein